MKKKLLKQIGNEWRANVWLGLELLIVSVVTWYILDVLAVELRIANEDMGFDYDNCYTVSVRIKTPESPGYIDHEANEGSDYEDYTEVMNRLNQLPEVIAAGEGSSFPFNYNFWGVRAYFELPGVDSIISNYGRINRIKINANYLKVFHTTGLKGESSDELAEMIAEGKAIVTSNINANNENGLDPLDYYNAKMTMEEDSTHAYQIGAVIPPIKRAQFEPAFHATLLVPVEHPGKPIVRLAPDKKDEFFRRIKEEINSLNYGNAYISEVKAISQIRDDLHRDDYALLRNLVICMGFLFITIFLGLLGTFWFRTQQRVQEIAIRKVTGATRPQIFRRLIGEGLLILLIVTPLAYCADLIIQHYDLSQSHQYYPEGAAMFTLCCVLAVALLLALMIIAGIYFPARKAMDIEPAEVLRGE